MHLAYVMTDTPGYTDTLLEQFAKRLSAQGARLAGLVQTNTEQCTSHHCDMDVHVLPDGPTIRISQSLGAHASGCRLDPDALEYAVTLIEQELQNAPELLLVNKFGKHEAEGRGLRQPIAEALSLDIPVLAGVNALNHAAFVDYSAGEAVRLPADLDAMQAWFERVAKADDLASEYAVCA